MNEFQKLAKNVKKVQPTSEMQTFWVRCKSVDWDNYTMDAIGVSDDLEVFEINLGLGDYVVKPKKGSKCLIGCIENEPTRTFLINAEKVEGYYINAQNENLKEVLNDYIAEFGKLCDELAKVEVSIGVTPNVPVINQIKTKVTQSIKNRLGKILV